MLQLNAEDVVAAGKVLFGPAFRAEGAAWRGDLKNTYRRRALETHPDRARAVGRSENDLALEFRRVSEAYRVLSQLAETSLHWTDADPEPPPPPRPARTRPRPPPRAARPASRPAAAPPRPAPEPKPPPAAAAAPAEPSAATAAKPAAAPADVPGHRVRYGIQPEALPRRKLRFAEFLYYSGRVPWTSFVEAIAWQRRQRPSIGRIAVEWGFLQPDDIGKIMEERRAQGAQQVPFGEFAVRLGYLTSFQLLAALGRQARMQRRIGEFFVESGLVEASEIDELLRRQERHNQKWKE